MSSCLSGGGGGRTYGFDLEIVKSPSPSTRSSSPSSTLSEASNSPRTLSTKRARTPRKRPNQTYTEAAALLSTVYPKVFPAKIPGRMCRHRRSHDSFAEPSELLPSFPALGDAAFLIRDPPSEAPSSFHLEPKPANFPDKVCRSSTTNGFQQPGSPGPLEDDFDAKSILDEETGEGIDSIMGNLSMDSNGEFPIVCTSTHHANPQFRSLMGFGLGGRFELGFGLRCNLRRALRNADNGDWWRSPTVAMLDIVPKFRALPPPSQPEKMKKKKKKKVEKEEVKELPSTASTNINTIFTSIEELRSSLLLKLNHEEVLKEWSDRGSPYAIPASDASGSPESTADILARLSEIDLFPEGAGGGAGGIREASVMRYKEKRRSRLFSKKIRYQVRKVNADRRPRMKASGRFVKRPSSSLLKEAIEQENL